MKRHPCERCAAPLYYHEQAQRWCRQCAAVLGVTRICDKRGVAERAVIEPPGRRLSDLSNDELQMLSEVYVTEEES